MRRPQRTAFAIGAVTLLVAAATAQKKQEFRVPVNSGAMISVINEYGPITVRPSGSNQVVITATPHSNKIEIDENKSSTRVKVRTHLLQKASADEARVDYDVQVPANVDVWLRSADGPISVERVNGDVTCEGESARIQVKDGGNGHVHIRTVDGPITLTNLKNAHVEVVSIGGDVMMSAANGPSVTVNTATGKIKYDGAFDGGGDYSFSTHSGAIEVSMPANASVELSARSVNGLVEDGFQFKPSQHPGFAPSQGKSFAGVANAGASSVKLRSFSGKISVKKK